MSEVAFRLRVYLDRHKKPTEDLKEAKANLSHILNQILQKDEQDSDEISDVDDQAPNKQQLPSGDITKHPPLPQPSPLDVLKLQHQTALAQLEAQHRNQVEELEASL